MLIVQKHLRAVTEALVGKDVAPIGELLDKIKQLQAKNKQEYVQHKDDCQALHMFFIRECPHCGSRKNHWQGGGPAFDAYRVCEECDGPAYIPEKRRGECACGLEQALTAEK